MKYLVVLCSFIIINTSSLAQVRLPKTSPDAFIKQTIGLTAIAVHYHAPGVKGRKIFGSLVPHGQLWQVGANEATKISFSDDVYINNEPIPAGTYSLFIIPEQNREWTVVFNRDTSLWGTEDYKELNDIAHIPVKPRHAPFHETLQFSFSNIGTNTGQLHLTWETIQLTLFIETEVEKKALTIINEALAKAEPEDWYTWARCAEYVMQQKEYQELALKWINKSISIKENFYNSWIKARLYAYNKEFQEAASLTAKAIELGALAPATYKTYAQEIETAYRDWKTKKY